MISQTPGMENIVEILTIGREILDGRVIDTNSTWIALELRKLGLTPRYAQRVDDDVERMIEAFAIAQNRSAFVIVTGGLGPTSDDLTAEVFAKFLGQNWTENPVARGQVEGAFKRINRPLTATQYKQAKIPESAVVLENSVGTAPGFLVEHQNTRWFFLPGVPREMKQMFLDHVAPKLPATPNRLEHQWATHFTSEGELQQRLAPVISKLPKNIELSFRTRYPENHIGLWGQFLSETEKKLFHSCRQEISTLLDSDVFAESTDSNTLPELEQICLQKAQQTNTLLATVESCTGGLVAERLTRVPGSSSHYMGSWVAYSNALKIELGVPEDILNKFGAVSEETAQAMARAGLAKMIKIFGASKSISVISTTGIAGPGGSTGDKPVGLCWVGIAAQNGGSSQSEVFAEKIQAISGRTRTEYQQFFSQKALNLIRQRL